MSSPDTEVRVLTASHDLDDYDILAMNMLSVAVPYQTTESLRKLIWAAMVTYVFGNSSVDHVIRRYGHLWEHRSHKSFESDARLLVLRSTQEDVAHIAERLEKTSVSPRLGAFVCEISALPLRGDLQGCLWASTARLHLRNGSGHSHVVGAVGLGARSTLHGR